MFPTEPDEREEWDRGTFSKDTPFDSRKEGDFAQLCFDLLLFILFNVCAVVVVVEACVVIGVVFVNDGCGNNEEGFVSDFIFAFGVFVFLDNIGLIF